MVKALLVLQEIEAIDGAVMSTWPQEKLMDTSTSIGRGIAALLFSLAEEELDKIRDNWRSAVEHAIAKGWYLGGQNGAPLGYLKKPRQPLGRTPCSGR